MGCCSCDSTGNELKGFGMQSYALVDYEWLSLTFANIDDESPWDRWRINPFSREILHL